LTGVVASDGATVIAPVGEIEVFDGGVETPGAVGALVAGVAITACAGGEALVFSTAAGNEVAPVVASRVEIGAAAVSDAGVMIDDETGVVLGVTAGVAMGGATLVDVVTGNAVDGLLAFTSGTATDGTFADAALFTVTCAKHCAANIAAIDDAMSDLRSASLEKDLEVDRPANNFSGSAGRIRGFRC
jgi:hypothetical protein